VSLPTIEVPNPLPPPIPGGGPETGYQWSFNERYYLTRVLALKPFAWGDAASEAPNTTALTSDQRTTLADKLYDYKAPGGPGVYGPNHVDFDQEIDYWGQDPYSTMYQRQVVYGYQRVPIGTGNTSQPPNVVNAADLQGPPEKGKYLLVTCDANLL